jgi:hypothetical protein
MVDLQEVLALAVVVAVVAVTIWRMWRRRGKSAGACSNCDTPGAGEKPKEVPLRFYRRRP